MRCHTNIVANPISLTFLNRLKTIFLTFLSWVLACSRSSSCETANDRISAISHATKLHNQPQPTSTMGADAEGSSGGGLFVIPESLPFTIAFAVLSGVFLTLATGATHFPAYIDRMVEKNLESEEETSNTSFLDDDSADREDVQPKKVSKKMWRVVREISKCK